MSLRCCDVAFFVPSTWPRISRRDSLAISALNTVPMFGTLFSGCSMSASLAGGARTSCSLLQRGFLDQDLVRITRTEIPVGVHHALHQHDIPDPGHVLGGDENIVGAIRRRTRAVAQMDPVLPEHL